ncbi:MAG: hypothetical protein WBC83_01720 [Minisyncoccia bacterium]
MDASKVLTTQIKNDLLEKLCFGFSVLHARQVIGYTEESSKLLKFLVDGEYIESKLVQETIHDRLLELGCAMQIMHLRTGTFPDHLGSDTVFGYALKHGKVHPADVTFDHGETAEEYILESDGLLEAVFDQLLSYKNPQIPFSLRNNDICCGSCS